MGNPNAFTKDKKLLNTVRKEGSVNCLWQTCEQSDLGGLVQDYIAEKGWDATVRTSDFDFVVKGTGFTASLYCPDGEKVSKTKCMCKSKKGKRKFKCSNLSVYK